MTTERKLLSLHFNCLWTVKPISKWSIPRVHCLVIPLMLLQREVFLLLQLMPRNPLLTCLHRGLKKLRPLKVRLDFFLLSNQAGFSLDLSTFMWVTVTCSFALLKHIEMGTSFLLMVPPGWALQTFSASSSLIIQPVFFFFLWYVLNSVKVWRLPLLLTPALSSAQ